MENPHDDVEKSRTIFLDDQKLLYLLKNDFNVHNTINDSLSLLEENTISEPDFWSRLRLRDYFSVEEYLFWAAHHYKEEYYLKITQPKTFHLIEQIGNLSYHLKHAIKTRNLSNLVNIIRRYMQVWEHLPK